MALSYYFNLDEAAVYRVLKWRGIFEFCRVLQKILFILFIAGLSLFFYGFIGQNFSDEINGSILGGSVLILIIGTICRLVVSFFDTKLKKPDILNENNLAEFLSFEAVRMVASGKLKDPSLDPVFYRLLLRPEDMEKIEIDFQPGLILEAKAMAEKRGCQRIESGDLLLALAKTHPVFKEIIIKENLRFEDFENLVRWFSSLRNRAEKKKKWWEYENLLRRGALAKEWTAGYTPNLDRFSIDWSEGVKKRGAEEAVGHKEALEHLERVLARTETNNALLVGEPGSGRKSVIGSLAQSIVFGQSLSELNYKRVVELDIVSILANAQSAEEATGVLDEIFSEVVSAGNIILVIDEFYNFVTQAKGSLGAVDISGVLARYLSLADFRLVGITSYYGLHLFVEKNVAILGYMEKVEVKEVSERETVLILQNFIGFLEKKYKKFIPYTTIREVVRYSGRYIKDVPFPKKAVDLLDEVLVYASRYGKAPLVLPEYVVKVISEKTDIPLGEIEIKEKDILLNLERLLHQRIINQEEAVREVSSALRRARSEITTRSSPMGTFLFLGPTGVGKTETSKALAAIYFGAENKMIRLDMSEFQDVKDIPRLLGSAEAEGLLAARVKEDPFSLVLLDEIEKAHPNILNLFLQVLDEGHLTDGFGRKIDFKSTIVIATSNAGYELILQALKEKEDWSGVKQKLLDRIFERGIFRPEFINRFDAAVVFKPLSKENLLAIAELMLQGIKNNLKEKGIEFEITLPLKEKISDLGYDLTFGARQMRRVLQDKVENALATALLSGEIQRGDKISIDPQEFKIIKNK